jgi:hypothetical protein
LTETRFAVPTIKTKPKKTHSARTVSLPPCVALTLHAGMPRPCSPPAHGTIVMTSLTNATRRALTSLAWDSTNLRSPTVGVCFGRVGLGGCFCLVGMCL